MNKKLRTMATENFLKTDSINVIKGYIPTDMEDEFTKVITNTLGSAYYLEIRMRIRTILMFRYFLRTLSSPKHLSH